MGYKSYFEDKKKALEAYKPELTRAEDFWDFWQETIKSVNGKNLDPIRIQIEYPSEYVKVYKISYYGYDKTRIWGWMAVPVFTKEEKLPCLIQYHGFTDSCGFPWQLMHWVMMGIAVIAVDCREQGGFTGNCADYITMGQVGNVVTKGLLDKREYYYRAVYIDCIRALDFAERCPEIDKTKLIVRGTSQGGALAMAVSSLDLRPALAIANVPSNSNIEKRVIGHYGSFGAVSDYLKRYPYEAERVFHTLSYFDIMNMAEAVRCPVFTSVALEDEVCPAACYYAAYNRISGEKEMVVYPFNGHDGARELHMEREMEYVKRKGLL